MLATTIITPAQMYLITRLDVIKDVLGFITFMTTVFFIMLLIVLFVATVEQYDRQAAFCARWLKKTSIALAIVCASLVFMPNLKEMCSILVVPAIANNERVQGLGEEFYDLAKEWMQELKPTKGTNK